MKCGRHNARHFRWNTRGSGGKIRVALQTNETNVGARQHPRVGRAMRLMTGLAAFKTQRCMLERKWTAFIAMAFETSRLIGREGLLHRRPDAAVRIVAIHALHVAFGKLVMEWPLELRPLI